MTNIFLLLLDNIFQFIVVGSGPGQFVWPGSSYAIDLINGCNFVVCTEYYYFDALLVTVDGCSRADRRWVMETTQSVRATWLIVHSSHNCAWPRWIHYTHCEEFLFCFWLPTASCSPQFWKTLLTCWLDWFCFIQHIVIVRRRVPQTADAQLLSARANRTRIVRHIVLELLCIRYTQCSACITSSEDSL